MSAPFDPYHKWLGIPPAEQPANHYRLLGVVLFEPDLDVVDAAANQRMAYLQDMASGPHVEHSQRILNEISSARRCLLNSQSKAAYDATLQQQISARTPAAPLLTPAATSAAATSAAATSAAATSAAVTSAAATSAAGSADPVPTEQRAPKLSRLMIGSLASISLISLVIALVMIFRGGDGGSRSGDAAPFGRLEMTWKLDERDGLFIMVDGKTLYDESKSPPAAETFAIKVRPGKHSFRLERSGYRTISYSNKFLPGETISLVLNWKSK